MSLFDDLHLYLRCPSSTKQWKAMEGAMHEPQKTLNLQSMLSAKSCNQLSSVTKVHSYMFSGTSYFKNYKIPKANPAMDSNNVKIVIQ